MEAIPDMAVRELRISGYRSLRTMRLGLGSLNVVTGPNGCGKSNLYRAMVLLAAASRGELARAFADEGGMPSALWAGPRRKGAVRLKLGVRIDEWDYEIACGLPTSDATAFRMDPLVKEESVRYHPNRGRSVAFLERTRPSAWLRDRDGRRVTYPFEILDAESALSQIQESHLYPELSYLRNQMSGWRFYHHFRTDEGSPMRQPQVGFTTPVLSSDGHDLAAALRTIISLGDADDLLTEIDAAFPGCSLEIFEERGRYEVALRMPGFQRPFEARELSDGTLRYLCILAALLSFRPATLIALNEPETSIHADLFDALARLIVKASERSQIWVTTHSADLAKAVQDHADCRLFRLELRGGETWIAGARDDD